MATGGGALGGLCPGLDPRAAPRHHPPAPPRRGRPCVRRRPSPRCRSGSYRRRLRNRCGRGPGRAREEGLRRLPPGLPRGPDHGSVARRAVVSTSCMPGEGSRAWTESGRESWSDGLWAGPRGPQPRGRRVGPPGRSRALPRGAGGWEALVTRAFSGFGATGRAAPLARGPVLSCCPFAGRVHDLERVRG